MMQIVKDGKKIERSDGAPPAEGYMYVGIAGEIHEVVDDRQPYSMVSYLMPAELQARMEAEGVWEKWLNYMFGATARRNALMKRLFRNEPIDKAETTLRNSLAAAGITAEQIERILA